MSVEARAVSKWFGDVVAVSEVSFAVGPGVTALLGPNGAGKSTLLRMLCGLARPSAGTVSVLGGDPRADVSLRRRIGLSPQTDGLFEPLTAEAMVTTAAELHGLADPGAAAVRALGLVGLADGPVRPVATFSRGMRQRVKVATALVHDPEVVFLDEPLTGLDPRQRLDMIDLIQRLGDEGRCLLISSHILDEVERFAANVLVIAQGRLAAQGDFRDIRELMDDRPHRIRVRARPVSSLAGHVMGRGLANGTRITGDDTVEIETNDVGRFRAALARLCRDHRIELHEVVPLDDDLDSVFRYLVGR